MIEHGRGATQIIDPHDDSTQGDTETELEIHPIERPTKTKNRKSMKHQQRAAVTQKQVAAAAPRAVATLTQRLRGEQEERTARK